MYGSRRVERRSRFAGGLQQRPAEVEVEARPHPHLDLHGRLGGLAFGVGERSETLMVVDAERVELVTGRPGVDPVHQLGVRLTGFRDLAQRREVRDRLRVVRGERPQTRGRDGHARSIADGSDHRT
jgi:hypothetical protein